MIRILTVIVQQASFPISVSRSRTRRWCAAAVLLVGMLPLLGGCAGSTPEPAPVPPARYAAAARLVPPDRVFSLSDVAAIPARVWPAHGREQAVVLALHGFNDSRDAWEYSAPALAGQGITLVAPDIRGFGGAPMRGGWAGTPRLLADTREEVALLRQEHPGVPLYLMGESMGGAVLMLLMSMPDAPDVAGTILLAPAVWNLGVGADIPLDILATLFPHSLVSGRELPVHVVASDNPAALIRLYYNPLTLRQTRLEALRGWWCSCAKPRVQPRTCVAPFCAFMVTGTSLYRHRLWHRSGGPCPPAPGWTLLRVGTICFCVTCAARWR